MAPTETTTAERFRRFAEVEARGYSPLYDEWCTGVSDDEFWQAQEPMLSTVMNSGRYPLMAALSPEAFGPDFDHFEFGLQRLLDGLEARNLAQRVPSASDRRSHELHLTREGEAFLVRLKALAREHEGHVEQRLGTKGRRDLLALLQRFMSA